MNLLCANAVPVKTANTINNGAAKNQAISMINVYTVFSIDIPYYMKFWRHFNLAILKNPYLAAL